jgi:hypothetical protein
MKMTFKRFSAIAQKLSDSGHAALLSRWVPLKADLGHYLTQALRASDSNLKCLSI